MPDGYSSNLARCVDVEKGRIHGMKSHDCHIFMESLLPTAFSALAIHVLNPLTEESLRRMEENIPIILCKLERIFPLGLFHSMEYLPIHLPYEALLGGPVQY